MKKYILLLCMLTCIFGLTACGDDVTSLKESTYNNQKEAEALTKEVIIPYMEKQFSDETVADEFVAEYNVYEIESLVGSDITALTQNNASVSPRDFHVTGNSMLAGVTSFAEAFSVIGEMQEIKILKNVYESEEIHIEAQVIGSKGNATAVLIFADDIFLTLESIALNQDQTTGELLQKAVYDTLMGVGSVFFVLLLISFIISLFGIIPKILDGKKEEAKVEIKEQVIDKPIAQIIEKEELSDDSELVAVIAAAIAASEGYVSTDGFFVRSIRKSNKRR